MQKNRISTRECSKELSPLEVIKPNEHLEISAKLAIGDAMSDCYSGENTADCTPLSAVEATEPHSAKTSADYCSYATPEEFISHKFRPQNQEFNSISAQPSNLKSNYGENFQSANRRNPSQILVKNIPESEFLNISSKSGLTASTPSFIPSTCQSFYNNQHGLALLACDSASSFQGFTPSNDEMTGYIPRKEFLGGSFEDYTYSFDPYEPRDNEKQMQDYISDFREKGYHDSQTFIPRNHLSRKSVQEPHADVYKPYAGYQQNSSYLPEAKKEISFKKYSDSSMKANKQTKGMYVPDNESELEIENALDCQFDGPSRQDSDAPILSPEELKQMPAIVKTKNGSKKTQQSIGSSAPEEISKFVYVISPYVAELMCDTYANYMCQTLFQNCNSSQRLVLLNAMQYTLVSIATSERGTHSLQSLIALASLPQEETIYLKHLAPKAVKLSTHIYGSHVIQRLLVSLKNKEVITEKFIGNIQHLSKNKLGLCVIKKCMYDSRVRNEILDELVVLMQDPYGNYAIQHLLEVWGPQSYAGLISSLRGNVAQLCIQKFSSNVMERFMREKRLRDEIIIELLHEDKIQLLLNCPYGCYVIKTAAEFADPKLKERLRNLILKVRQLLYVKKLAPRWEEIITILDY